MGHQGEPLVIRTLQCAPIRVRPSQHEANLKLRSLDQKDVAPVGIADIESAVRAWAADRGKRHFADGKASPMTGDFGGIIVIELGRSRAPGRPAAADETPRVGRVS
jgi:hypothetical protein